ncbi:hypothetical protein SAMD00019534_083410 [Acytostelium subglobosum LB1]|uniref:hypothetical protein n=1 Tax=Acytostelium subglobosum LB1 TaxID=1410327 RepID=UPI000644BA93|nr:hypothetical protein SAMD00019534_083410 [Acytostelium subglobosum LB1]GAM25166.1 hypothetical protein SAMD00019534_083410 [Acytostelium subglobosum LB1]|eukprot:XP_012751686.1 hypothetical protein SAMD00019534_083410 [Acytostelium subglobosum LB1]
MQAAAAAAEAAQTRGGVSGEGGRDRDRSLTSPNSSQVYINNYSISPTASQNYSTNRLSIVEEYQHGSWSYINASVNNSMEGNVDGSPILETSLNSFVNEHGPNPDGSTLRRKKIPRKNEDRKVIRLVRNLAISDLLASLSVLVSRILFLKYNNHFVTSTGGFKDVSLCSISSGFIAFSFLASCCWTTVISFHIYRIIVKSRTKK